MAFVQAFFSLKSLLAGLLMVAVQSVFYWGAKLLIRGRRKHEAPVRFDAKIPFIPASVVPYMSSFVFWAVSYMAMSVMDFDRYCVMLAAETLGSFICFVMYVAIPTEITPPKPPEGFWGPAIRFLQWTDHPPVNLFPSMHCMASGICFLATLGVAPAGWQAVSLLWGLAIVVSTVTVKQHYLPDTFSGLITALVAYGVCLRQGIFPQLAAKAVTGLFTLLGLT